jgi:hypothetical protein
VCVCYIFWDGHGHGFNFSECEVDVSFGCRMEILDVTDSEKRLKCLFFGNCLYAFKKTIMAGQNGLCQLIELIFLSAV